MNEDMDILQHLPNGGAVVAVITVVVLLVLLSWGGFGWGSLGGYGFPVLGVVVLVCLIVWVAKGAPMPS
jgi:uncharacterized membrane protein YkvI